MSAINSAVNEMFGNATLHNEMNQELDNFVKQGALHEIHIQDYVIDSHTPRNSNGSDNDHDDDDDVQMLYEVQYFSPTHASEGSSVERSGFNDDLTGSLQKRDILKEALSNVLDDITATENSEDDSVVLIDDDDGGNEGGAGTKHLFKEEQGSEECVNNGEMVVKWLNNVTCDTIDDGLMCENPDQKTQVQNMACGIVDQDVAFSNVAYGMSNGRTDLNSDTVEENEWSSDNKTDSDENVVLNSGKSDSRLENVLLQNVNTENSLLLSNADVEGFTRVMSIEVIEMLNEEDDDVVSIEESIEVPPEVLNEEDDDVVSIEESIEVPPEVLNEEDDDVVSIEESIEGPPQNKKVKIREKRGRKPRKNFDEGSQLYGKYELKPNIICKVCGMSFTSGDFLSIHRKTHLEHGSAQIKPSVCRICGMSFANQTFLNIHRRTHVTFEEFTCEICNKTFERASSLKQHKQVHEVGSSVYKCIVCFAAFASKADLEVHQQVHEVSSSIHKCVVCCDAFTSKAALENHKKVHEELFPFACELCSSVFSTHGKLESHKRNYCAATEKVCHTCNKVYTGSLAMHSKEHERSVKCDTCGKKFVSRKSMLCHQKQHVKCDVCQVKFAKESELLHHKETHVDIYSKCSICSELLKCDTMDYHMRLHASQNN